MLAILFALAQVALLIGINIATIAFIRAVAKRCCG